MVKTAFENDRTILSFDEYLELLLARPQTFARNSAQYVRDVFDHFGTETRAGAGGPVRRFKLFDLDLDGEGRVAGQEEVQNAIYRILGSFVRLGQVNKLILLHGPNGSAKSSLVAAIMRGMEAYSRTPEGALYRFNWLFPSEKTLHGGSLGFHDRASASRELSSFAHLEGEALDTRLTCELKDHPLFLIPKAERKGFLETHFKEKGADDFVLSRYVLEGDLCHKCRSIFDALLGLYHGDYLKVLRHVQVERFFVNRRYQQAVVTVEPQMSVDAAYHQVTADKSVANLPPALQSLSLFEPYGPLVLSNRGMVEYADLLKRPVEAFKYLLGTSETAMVPLEHFVLHLDALLLASSNDKHVVAFKELPDFASFKGRIELVRVPYLRTWRVEQEIYDQKVNARTVGRHVAPHATRVAAMWAVLTRLKKPISDRFAGALKDIVDDLSPVEKLQLYDHSEIPDRLSMQQGKELKSHVAEVWRESDTYPRYEGGAGASAREVKTALFNAAQDPERRCLTPLSVLAELRSLCRDKSVYEYLQQEVIDGFHDHEEFVKLVEAEYLDLIDEEIRDSLGLISEAQYRELFERYVLNVSHWVKGEKLQNRVTGDYDRPSEPVMTEMEAVVMPKDQDRGEFRRGLISAIGAFKLDHPNDAMDYPKAFPELFRRVRDHYFDERKKTLKRHAEKVLRFLADDKKDLSPKDLSQVEDALKTMRERYGYCEACAQDAILFLMKKRYAG
ncbi:MAG: serine protein kinase PrkA [Deltaproteobacteria bacterium]|nr:serine protein kinase PrkA [Deltaproteobacteria bacterium]